jgi:hypothetical protein
MGAKTIEADVRLSVYLLIFYNPTQETLRRKLNQLNCWLSSHDHNI